MARTETIDTSDRVLVVEDEAFIATEIERQLNHIGFERVDVCLTYDEAETHVLIGGYDLIVFDVVVSDKIGLSLISDSIAKGCAVVTTSGYLTKTHGLQDTVFIAKPVRPEALEGAIVQAQARVNRADKPVKLRLVSAL